MREQPAAMLPTLPGARVVNQTWEYDWLANSIEHTDDAQSFYERSIGDITNGYDEGRRPSALYLSSNLRKATVPPTEIDPATDRGGWLELDYGEGGNVVAMTVHARCHDRDASTACYDNNETASIDDRRTNLRASCVCAAEQHYQYRWDELNRLVEARRYDRAGTGQWNLMVRQRYRYDAGNARLIKQTVGEEPGDPVDRVHLYVYPGDYDRSGLEHNEILGTYDASTTLGTETQYLVGGARIVWKQADDPGTYPFSRDVRITYGLTDLIQSTGAVIDLHSGKLLESTTYYPNGGVETHRTQSDTSVQPEPLGFTGKEADDEVGVVYFGERYLIPRIGRWASPDPLHVHAVGGGEALNSFHYVSGNLLQARDPVGLYAESWLQYFDTEDDYEAWKQNGDTETCTDEGTACTAIVGTPETGFTVYQWTGSRFEFNQESTDNWNANPGAYHSKDIGFYYEIVFAALQSVAPGGGASGAVRGLGAARNALTRARSLIDDGFRILKEKGAVEAAGLLFERAAGQIARARAYIDDAVGRLRQAGERLWNRARELVRSVGSGSRGAAEEVRVIGRQADTAVAQNWPGHRVLNDPNWTLARNDAWIAEGIANRQAFYMASPRAGNMVQASGRFAGQPTVYARELAQLEAAGYQRVGDYMVHPDNVATFVAP